ncbi:hypothetical protein V6N12_064713 [Hibiscus sabdariffa]|uniref:Uncharacterized protein n=1 Tax=Hibiscus sabdariffa TaxID=183260 RepID=A0ABR2G6K9_9ROSI
MAVRSLVFSPESDGRNLYRASDDGLVHIYDSEGKAIIRAVSGHSSWAVEGVDLLVCLFDPQTVHPHKLFPVPFGQNRFAFPSKAQTISSGSISGITHSFLDQTPDPYSLVVFPTRKSNIHAVKLLQSLHVVLNVEQPARETLVYDLVKRVRLGRVGSGVERNVSGGECVLGIGPVTTMPRMFSSVWLRF